MAGGALVATPALAQTTGTAWNKLARDLPAVVAAPTTPALNWTKDVNSQRYVKVLVIATPGSKAELTALRSSVLAAGGSVFYRFMAVHALSVLLPANKVVEIAQRSDVQGISPNRPTAKTVSSLEAATGVMGVRTGTTGYSAGINDTGVGIARLDSGVAWANKRFFDAAGKNRVQRAIDVLRVGDGKLSGGKSWDPGLDYSADFAPASKELTALEGLLDAKGSTSADPYGHGRHVASVAAGKGFMLTPDSTGISPNANLYDVRVLDSRGVDQVSDVLAGIDRVIVHAKEYNIRVMNPSLAADSTERWQTDPLARAARSAVAAGITVVVAPGNRILGAMSSNNGGAGATPTYLGISWPTLPGNSGIAS